MFQADLICALCNKQSKDTGYRMMLNIAICNKCVDQLILEALQRVELISPKGVQ